LHFFFQAEDGIRDRTMTGVQTCALPISACATARAPGVRITDVSVLAGTYTGNINEFELPARPVRMVIHPDGSFEITAAEPRGFRSEERRVGKEGRARRWWWQKRRKSSGV